MAALCFAWLFWLGLHLECEMEVAEATAAVMAAMQMVTIEKRMVGVEGVTLGEEREGREAQAWSLTRRGLSCGLYISTALAGEPTHLSNLGRRLRAVRSGSIREDCKDAGSNLVVNIFSRGAFR